VRLVLLLAALALACSRAAPPPVYGLGTAPEQRFRFSADERTEIDGTPVTIERAADVVLRALPSHDGDTPVDLYVDRYSIQIDGAPGGASELSISADGLSARTIEGPVTLGAKEPAPGGDTVLELRARPVASVVLDTAGAATHPIWTSPHPVWTGVALLDWMLLALPTRPAGGEAAWIGARPLPQIGSYALGVDLPMRWERRPGSDTLRGEGRVARDSLHLADGFDGRADVEAQSEVALLPDGRVREAVLRLALDFAATNGTHVQSSHKVRLTCSDCAASVNPLPEGSDTGKGRDGTPQQGHLDDLSDHGGVRRGL